ncbi:DCC1-like thiol-disulfide oxidoreductase family protein [uncultured Zobellia sp.]|uniref:DCC1-like thiol-disulfide oxidoreductase family protein n=1 Tax=uncultured Zobellia sp. TaxID=255433 RepID=UPI00259AAEFA|nr:DCC1-like thiol-disulfide oxidoreductase family protein [uncultured Zobellia sp.]
MKRIITRLYDKKIDASGLAIFRLCFSLVMLCEVIQIFYFRHLIYDKIPYIELSEIDYTIPLILWMVSIVFLAIGLFTRIASIVNYIFCLVFIATINSYEYHMFYVYMGVSFLFLFTSIEKVFSLDRLGLILKHSNTRVTYKPSRKTSVLNYYAYVLCGIAFVYFDSIFYKTASYNWLNGMGMWLPSSLPQITHLDIESFLLNSKWLALFLGYVTFVFEAVFLFTFFRKKWRLPLLIIGIGLHIGILIEFPLPWFGLGVSALYLLMIPVSFWRKIREKLSFKKAKLIFYYDEECPLCNRTKIIINYLDFFNAIEFKGVQTFGFGNPLFKNIGKDDLLDNIYSTSNENKIYTGIDTYKVVFKRIPLLFPFWVLLSIPGIYHIGKWIYKKVADNRYVERCTEENCGFTPPNFPSPIDDIKLSKAIKIKDLKIGVVNVGLIFILILQINITLNSLLINNFKQNIGFTGTSISQRLNKFSIPLHKFSKTFFGVTTHAVFMDTHFNDYNHIVAIEAVLDNGEKLWLPIIDKEGNPDKYIYSFNWVKWTFRVNNPNINQKTLERGVRDFIAFWAHKNSVNVNTTQFLIKVKKVDIPTQWEKDFLTKQMAKPWLDGGYVEWKNDKFYGFIKGIESL